MKLKNKTKQNKKKTHTQKKKENTHTHTHTPHTHTHTPHTPPHPPHTQNKYQKTKQNKTKTKKTSLTLYNDCCFGTTLIGLCHFLLVTFMEMKSLSCHFKANKVLTLEPIYCKSNTNLIPSDLYVILNLLVIFKWCEANQVEKERFAYSTCMVW